MSIQYGGAIFQPVCCGIFLYCARSSDVTRKIIHFGLKMIYLGCISSIYLSQLCIVTSKIIKCSSTRWKKVQTLACVPTYWVLFVGGVPWDLFAKMCHWQRQLEKYNLQQFCPTSIEPRHTFYITKYHGTPPSNKNVTKCINIEINIILCQFTHKYTHWVWNLSLFDWPQSWYTCRKPLAYSAEWTAMGGFTFITSAIECMSVTSFCLSLHITNTDRLKKKKDVFAINTLFSNKSCEIA